MSELTQETIILFILAFLLRIIEVVKSIKKSIIKFNTKIKSMYTFIPFTNLKYTKTTSINLSFYVSYNPKAYIDNYHLRT